LEIPGTGIDDWETHWDRYADAAELNPAQEMRFKTLLAALRKATGRPERLLDIGSGQGDFLTLASQKSAAKQYVGFELSSSGVAVSKKKAPAVDFRQVDLFDEAATPREYLGWATAAVCSEVIEHVDDPVAFLRSARRFLAPGATLIVTVPGGPMSAFDRYIGHRHHYSQDLVRHVLDRAGFDMRGVRLTGFPFFNLYRFAVILRGKSLIAAFESDSPQPMGRVARFVMTAFRTLFNFNLPDFPGGWQLVATARNRPAEHAIPEESAARA
jgi:SAM-dependent methyltransferase